LPYLKLWNDTYGSKGLVIIGVHSPEFEFEKSQENVEAAVKRFGIKYPVAMDNQFATWNAFHNKFWPAHYLINQDGKIVYTHSGEGDYDVTENNIRVLLGLNTDVKPSTLQTQSSFTDIQTPETYLGTKRSKNFVDPKIGTNSASNTSFTFPIDLMMNQWALEGHWRRLPEYIQSLDAHAAIRLHFNAKKVFLVLGTTTQKTVHVHIALKGRVMEKSFGVDAAMGNVVVDHEALYELINLDALDEGILDITADEPGLKAYAFTFGS
jgi:hypothetical protein